MVHVVRTWTNDLIFKGMRYVAHTWQLNLSGYSILANPWRLMHLLLSLNYFKTRPLKLNSTYSFFFIQAGFMSSITFIFSFLSLFHYLPLTTDYQLQNINTIWRRKQYCPKKDEQKQRREYSSHGKQNSYGIPPWKTGAALLSRPLFRVFPRGDSVAKATAKLGSSITVRLRELTGGLHTSN